MDVPDVVVKGDGIVLRTLRLSDVDDVVQGASDPLSQRFLPNLPSPYGTEEALDWITVRAPAVFTAGGGAFAIADPETDRLLGGCGLHPQAEGVAEVGYWVAPWARQRGVATAAARTIAAYGLERGFQRLILRTERENTSSQRVAIAAGFTREGIQRGGGANRGGDGRHDLIVWARLHTDPPGPVERLLPDLPPLPASAAGPFGGAARGLTDGVVTLRPLGPDDTDDTYELRARPDVLASAVPPGIRSRDTIARICARAESAWLAGERADFTVRDAATGAYAGEIGLYYWDPQTQEAMIGYSMAPAWRGRGYATRAARLVARWAFEVGIERLIAGTLPENVGSQRVLERAGFLREGYLRARLPGPDGHRVDDLLYALLPGPTTQDPESPVSEPAG